MNYKMIGRYMAAILGLEAVFMIPALIICLADGEFDVALSFLISIIIILAVSGSMFLFCRHARKGFYAREGMICVGLSWILMSALGCLPFCISGQIPNYIDALFEMVSGFTTTGASILAKVESLSRGILYWRSFSHWLGGMGVLVFLLAFTSAKGSQTGFTLHLLRAESPGPNVGKLVPRMKQTAILLYIIYLVLTVLNVIFLLVGGMPLFDAVCTAFGTAGTGGFGIKNDSIASYSPYIQVVCTVFMALFGINFSCYYLLLIRNVKSIFKDEELRLYIGLIVASTVVISFNVYHIYASIGDTIRHASFQVSSIITTTGFATTDFNQWPTLSKTILLLLMVIGASAGSTGGGLKCARAILLFKSLKRSIKQALYPNKIQTVKLNGAPVSEKVLANTNVYLIAYVIIVLVSILFVAGDGFSIETNVSAVLACFNNIGPGLHLVGPTGNYGGFSYFSKIVLIVDMLAGRLEIIPILTLFTYSTWKRK